MFSHACEYKVLTGLPYTRDTRGILLSERENLEKLEQSGEIDEEFRA